MKNSLTDAQICRHFVRQKCGGCTFLHVPYTTQIESKRAQVVAILTSAFRDLPVAIRPDAKSLVKPTAPSPKESRHRASARFCLQENRSGHKTVGLFQQGTRVVVDTAGCPANVDLANGVVERLFADNALLPAKFYDHQDAAFQKNRLKFATVRTSPSGGGTIRDAAVILSHTGVDKGAMTAWLSHAGLAELCVYESLLVKADGERITGRSIKHLSGPETFPYRLGDEVFTISPGSFFQANHELALRLIEAATAFAEDAQVLLDLYGGFGAYSFHARRRCQQIIVVDGNKEAIAACNLHARELGASHVKGFAAYCEHFLEKTLPATTAKQVTHVIVNPSRAGMSPQVRQRLSRETFPSLKAVHYVSCSPATFARDAKALLQAGLTLESVQPFDMFPHADHVEVVGIFRAAR